MAISFTNCLSSFLSAPPPPSSSSSRTTQLQSSSITLLRRTTPSETADKLVCYAKKKVKFQVEPEREPSGPVGRGFNVEVIPYEDESYDRLVSRFRREVIQAGIFREIMKRRHYENAREKKIRKTKEAAKRNSILRRGGSYKPRFTRPDEGMEEMREVDVVDSDNWDLPEGDDIPY